MSLARGSPLASIVLLTLYVNIKTCESGLVLEEKGCGTKIGRGELGREGLDLCWCLSTEEKQKKFWRGGRPSQKSDSHREMYESVVSTVLSVE